MIPAGVHKYTSIAATPVASAAAEIRSKHVENRKLFAGNVHISSFRWCDSISPDTVVNSLEK